jgi:hypothetical protein
MDKNNLTPGTKVRIMSNIVEEREKHFPNFKEHNLRNYIGETGTIKLLENKHQEVQIYRITGIEIVNDGQIFDISELLIPADAIEVIK